MRNTGVLSSEYLNKAGRGNLRINKAAIEALGNILNDASMKKILGNEMDDILFKFTTAHKSSNWRWNKFAFEEHMRMLKVIANKYEGVEGFNKSLRDALNNPNPEVQDGFWHMMKDLEKRKIQKEKVKAFDMEFDGDNLPCIKCKFDLELINSNAYEVKYLEYKSYSNASRISKPQFLNYISIVDKIEQLQYVFRSKLSLDNTKDGMKDFFTNNKQEIFSSMKTVLKESVLGSGNANRFDLFEQAINNKNSNLYKIITIQ